MPAIASYASLLAERFANGLLDPFQCAGCGRLHLDPGGTTEDRQPLCIWCADPVSYPEPDEPRPNLSSLREGTIAELSRFAIARRISVEALEMAQRMGTARVGRVCGFSSIVLLDESGRCAEARRIDGKTFPEVRTKAFDLGERKAHTIRHSHKNWPVGILPRSEYRDKFKSMALVEGGPDYLTGLHFTILQKRTDVQPVAILGRGQASGGFHPASLDFFRDRRVRIYPHVDGDSGGLKHAIAWGRQLQRLNCEVDLFRFDGLRKIDGSPVKDLNDCASIAPDQAQELGGLFP
jgi:hypothetical protein